MFPKNMGIPKWMVENFMENPIKMDDLGVPLFLETPSFWLPGKFPWLKFRISERASWDSSNGVGC